MTAAPRRRGRLRPRRRRGWLWVGLVVAIVGFDLRIRRRLSFLKGIEVVDPVGGPVPDQEPFVLYTGPGVRVDDATLAAAISYARSNRLQVLDLVPGDAPVGQVIELASLVDPGTYRTSSLAPGHGALHAVVVRADVARRAGFDAPDGGPVSIDGGRVETAGWAAMARLTATAKLYAPCATDLVVSPGLAAVVPDPAGRMEVLRARYGPFFPSALATPAVVHGLVVAGLVLSPGWGLAALAAFLAEPFVATAGTAVRPGDLTPGQAARRLVSVPAGLARTVFQGRAAAAAGTATPDPIDSRRAEYAALLAEGTERFFEPRRDTCPLCGHGRLAPRLRARDFVQSKPGEFTLDQCRGCGHIFQNPRLSVAGLDFYYRDFYDGLGAGQTELVFAFGGQSHRGRVELVGRHCAPRAWLDVGSGYGHFCLIAGGLMTETRFDGLDMGQSIDEAARRGWVARGYRGLFPELAGQLAGSYDVVSMHHYLEHTRDPLAELDAAGVVLESGGHLLIEVPNPESRFGRLMGRWWLPWFQPQHQHFLSVANLQASLQARGFSVVEVELGPAHQSADFSGSALFLANQLAPPPRVPWCDPPTPARRLRRAATMAAAAPLLAAGLVLDQALGPLVKRSDSWSNAYRVLARRD